MNGPHGFTPYQLRGGGSEESGRSERKSIPFIEGWNVLGPGISHSPAIREPYSGLQVPVSS